MSPRPQYEQSIQFLEIWEPEGPWVLTAITPDKKSISTQTFHDIEDVHPWLSRHGPKRNIYFTVNPLRGPVDKKPERADVAFLSWLHVDVDPRAGEDVRDEQRRALKLLRNPPDDIPPPTVIVFSGGGYQGFWKLREPYSIQGEKQKYEEAKRWNIQLELAFGADHCHNVDRIMRLPGTINRPDERKKEKGRTEALARVVDWFEERVYELSQFTPAAKTQTDDPGIQGNMVSISGNIERLASVDDLPEGVPQLCKVVIVQGHDPDNPSKWPSRSEALFWVVCELVRRGCNDDTIYSVITDPDFRISESVLDKGSSADRYAIHQIERARERAVDPHLMELNQRHAVISSIGGKCRIISEEPDTVIGRSKITYQSFADFANRYCNRRVETVSAAGNPTTQPLGKWWVGHPMRKQFDTVVFSPGIDVPNCYNLWRGFAFESRPGNCELFLKHVKENVCNGNMTLYHYLIGWMASAVQKPNQPGHTAIVMRGRQGTGKGFAIKTFGRLFGRHFMQITDSKHLTGSFNAHLEDCVVLFADEAFYAGDKQHESVLKGLITEETMALEKKGVDTGVAANYLHLMMASNNQWVVPAGANERRFVVLDVNTNRMQDSSYFKEIQKQLDSGGYEALLHFLMHYDLSDFNVRMLPNTPALQQQKMFSFTPEEEWWFRKLTDGQLLEGEEEWPDFAFASTLLYDFISYTRSWGRATRSNATRLGHFMSRVCPIDWELKAQLGGKYDVVCEDGEVRNVSRPRIYKIPALSTCREVWNRDFGGPFDWSDPRLYDSSPQSSPF